MLKSQHEEQRVIKESLRGLNAVLDVLTEIIKTIGLFGQEKKWIEHTRNALKQLEDEIKNLDSLLAMFFLLLVLLRKLIR